MNLLSQVIREYLFEIDLKTLQDTLAERDSLPFEELFNGQLRIILPFVSDNMKDIKEILEDDYGIEVDIAKKKAYVPKETKKGTKKVEVRLGKLLNKLEREARKKLKAAIQTPEQEAAVVKAYQEHGMDHARFFLHNKKNRTGIYSVITDEIASAVMEFVSAQNMVRDYGEETGGEMAVVISRAPIDVLRMSDFKNIKSCHSKGGSYWKCAVAEAQDGGAVAYLVRKEDLDNIDDINQAEVFYDKDRNIPGMKPLSRVRLRNYIVDYGDEYYELAIPEDRTYGEDIDGFQSTLLSWARNNQVDDFKDENGDIELPSPEDIKIRGGSYSDTPGGILLNSFFDTSEYKYSWNPEYENPVNSMSIAEQYEQEANQYYEDLASDIENVNIYYDVHDEDDYPGLGGAFVDWRGEIILSAPDDEEYYTLNTNDELEQALGMVNATNSVVDLSKYELISHGGYYNDSYTFDITPDGGSMGHPDDFADFLRYCQDIDTAFPAMQKAFEEAYWKLKKEYQDSIS